MPVSPTRLLVAISLLHGATHLYTIFLSPLNHHLKDYFGLEADRQVTFIQTLYFVVYACSNLLAGVLATRYSPRMLLTIGPTLNGLAVMSMWLLGAGDYAWMCFLTALGACGGGLYHPVANVLLTETFPHAKGRALGYVGIGASLAFTIGPWSAGALVDRAGWTWQEMTLLFGAIGIGCGVYAWLNLPDKSPSGANPLRPAESNVEPKARPVLIFAALAIAVMGGRELASWGTANITSLYLHECFGAGSEAGFLMVMIFAPGLIVQPLAGRWSDVIGREHVLLIAMLAVAVALFAMPYTPPAWLFAAYLLFGTGMLATIPTFEALVADRTPVALRGLVFGIVISSGLAMGALGPYLTGAVADAGLNTHAAYARSFAMMGAITAVCGAMVLTLKPAARRLGLMPEASPPIDTAVPAGD